MTHRSLSTPNSGLRVFSASLLSALLIMMPFVQLAAAEKRSEVRALRSDSGRPAANEGQQDKATNAAAENVFLNAPVPKPAPEPPALAPTIVATKDDGLAAATTVAPGGTITYTVNITNTGINSPADDATNVQFSDTIDGSTSLVPGSPVAAVSDKYNAIGNVQMSIPDGATDLLGNDFDPDTGNNAGMTVTAETKSSTSCTGGCSNNVTINADGSFTYDPPVGFSGTDTFTYTAISGTSTATQTVTITVANEIWFINNNAGACPGAPCDGRLSHPFVSLAAFNAANLGGAGQPGDNDWIFIYESALSYDGPATLRNGQKFIGQDATASLATLTGFPAPSGTDPLPVMNSGNGTFVNIIGANVNGINLLSGNTLRGFRVGNVGTGTKISGTSFGTLVVGNSGSPDVLLHGTGQALNLTTGTLSLNGGFVSVTTTSSAAQGINLAGVADSGVGAFSFGSTSVSNSTTQGINIGTTTADLNFGSTTVSSTGSAINISMPVAATNTITFGTTSATTTGAGTTAVSWTGVANTTLTFDSLSITRNNGTALNATGGGTINVTNATGSITNTTPAGPAIVATGIALNANFLAINSTGGANGVNLTNVTGTSNFGTGQLTGTSGGATFLVSGGTATVTYSGHITQSAVAGAAMVSIIDHGTGGVGTITFQTGTLSATTGAGISFDNADGTYNFNGTTTLNGGNAHLDWIDSSGGTFTFGANTTITSPSGGPAFSVGSVPGNPTITYSGSITQNNAHRVINIDGTTGNTITFQTGTITGGASSTGVNLNNVNGNVTFSNGMTMGTSVSRMANQAVTITNGASGATYSLGAISIFTNNVTGINAAGFDGTLNIPSGTVDTNQGTTVNIDGPGGLTTLGISLTRVVSSGGTNTGLSIQDTVGSFAVTGSGSSCTSAATCTGGSLSNKSGAGNGTDGVFLRNVTNFSLTRVFIQDNNGNGIFGGSVNGFKLDNCFINSNADSTTGNDHLALGFTNEANVHLVNVSGTAVGGANETSIANTTITNAFEHDVEIDQTTGTLTEFRISSSTITNDGASTQAVHRVLYIMNGGAGVSGLLTVQDSTITGNTVAGALTADGVSATVSAGTMNVKVFRNLIQNHGDSSIDLSTSTGGILNFDITDNGGSGGVANNGASNGRINESEAIGINIFTNANSTGSVNGFIRGNTIGTQGVAGSGSAVGRGMQFQNEGSVNSRILISGNIVQSVAGNQEINVQHGIAVAGAAGTTNATIINNTLRDNTSTSRPLNTEILNSGTLCVDISGNTFSNNIGQGGGSSLLRVNEGVTNTPTMNVRQATPTAAANALELDDANGLSFAGGQVTVAGTPNFSQAACTQPTALAMSDIPNPNRVEYLASNISSDTNTPEAGTSSAIFLTSIASTLTSSAGETGARIALNAHKAEARDQRSEVTERKSETSAHHAVAESRERNVDALSQKSERSHVARTNRAVAAPLSGDLVTANIGTLPAGSSVTITFQVTVDNPPNLTLLNPPRVENQGTVTFNEVGSPVLTDDPNVVGAADKTATRIDLFDTTTTLASNLNPSNSGDSVTFTATINETPAQTPDPSGTVDFIDTNNGNAVICNDVVVTAGSAQCITSALTAGTHDMQAVYSGDGNFEGSTSNTVSQVVVACVANPVVTKIADTDDGFCDADCSLREAIGQVCSGTTITFDTAGVFATAQTITLSLGELSVGRNVTIDGPDLAIQQVTVSGNNASRVFNINSGKTVTIRELTITGGSNGSGGGGILNDHGTLTLINTTVSGNTSGGGINVDGTTSGSASLTVINSTISGNTSTSSGGGIYSLGSGGAATLIITNSTISGNNANIHGGGLYLSATTSTLTNVTVTNNRADNDNSGTGAGGGLGPVGGTVTLHNTIVAGNFNDASPSTTRDDINGTIDAAGSFNLIGDGTGMTGITNGTNSNQVGTGVTPINALLAALADNGGLTFTHALLAGSPAIEAGSNTISDGAGLTTDQRGTGYPRKADSADADTTQTVDIGAYEAHPTIQDIANQMTTEDTPINFNFNIGDDTGALITGGGGSVTATSSNTTLVPNLNLVITDPAPPGGGARNLSITPALNQTGTTTITVTVTATNGRTAVDTFDLNVTADNDNPTITTNTGTTVNEGSSGNVIDNTKLAATDVDNTAAQLTFTVGTAPANGTLKNNGVGLSGGGTFTQTDINSNLITYDHNGGETTSDSFTFTVTDGAGGSAGPATFNITVTPQNDNPTIGNNTGTTVNEGSTANTITNAMLSVNDVDNTAAQITFTVGTAPANGTLKNNGVGLLSGGTFTQADINGNLLTYDHDGTNTTSDSFTFTVSDGAGGSIGSTAFNITVTAQNDAPVVTATGANLAYAEGDPATAVDTGLTVTDGDSANLTGASASITTNFQSGQDVLGWIDNDGGDNITLSGTSTAQTIVLTGADTPANYQAALRAVTYQNSSENPSTLTRTVTFTANDGTSTGQATRSIDVSASNDSPTLTTNAGLTVLNSGTGTIDNTKLQVDDVDNTAAELTFTVGTATTNGTLKKGVATLSAGGTFTQDDINNNQITYTHGGAGASDSFTFTVSDGAGGSIGSTTFNITISDPDVSIHDAKVAEPASPSTVDMVFTIALSTPAAEAISVNFTTNNGSAIAGTCGNPGADYVLTSGMVNFAIGDQVKTINVPICSDAVADDGETFTVTLNTPVNVNIVDGTATGTITANTPGTVLISELRTSGPLGAGDDFVEIYNNSNSPLTVAASDASAGYGLYKMGADCNAAPVLIGVIPNGTVIPARGHYLFVGSAYSLGNYGGSGAAAGNLTFSSDIETDANVGLFSTSDVTGISSVNRLDAVGFGANVGGACDLLREASNLPPIAANATIEHSYFRKMCDWLQGQGCTVPGIPKDTNNNADDFWLADTAGSAITGRLGAPGPENLASPIRRDSTNNPGSGGINVFLLDGTVGSSAGANRDRNGGDPAGTFGSMKLRYRVTNNTGGNVTRLRYRIVDMSTAIQSAGPTSDLRALTSSIEPSVGPVQDSVTCTAGGAGAPPCTVTVQATTLETPPNQAIGGGYNSTLSSGTITTGTPLPNGQSILINFKLGVEKTGQFRFYIIVEALP